MGADQFEEYLIGKDLSKAFTAAVERAAYDYGHAGYTGTIAEKYSYVELGPLPPRMTMGRFDKLIWEYQQWVYSGYDYKTGRDGKPKGANPVPESWRDFVKKAAELYDDKWGPALVVEITGQEKVEMKKRLGRAGTRDRVWVAFGLASS